MKKRKLILYGAGSVAELLLSFDEWKEYYQVIAIVDSDTCKQGKMFQGIQVVSLSDALRLEWDNIVISVSGDFYREIKNILDKSGIPSEKILSVSQVYNSTNLRDDEIGLDKKTGLVIIFNHCYEKNISKLRKIYGDRFSEIRFLMPFYFGQEQDVIPVYESSYYFQGFVAQAYTQLMGMDVEYFLFIADDLIINHEINEWNAAKKLRLSREKEIFCFNFSELNRPGQYLWCHTRNSSLPFRDRGVEWRDKLPSKEEAFAIFKDFMRRDYPKEYEDALFQGCDCSEEEKNLFYKNNGGTKEVPYPLAWGYSDIFAVKKTSMRKVAHVFGIFAAMGLFVEIAVPTAIVLTVKRSNVVFNVFSEFKEEMILWDNNRLDIEKKFEKNIHYLLDDFPEECLCIHPVKLSRWVI